VTLYH